MQLNKRKSFSLLVLFLVCVFIPVYAFSAPFLTCDPQAGITHYSVTVAGSTYIVKAAEDTRLMFDLVAFGPGDYHFEVYAMMISEREWGISSPAPFDGKCVLLGPVSGLSVVNQ